MRLMKNLPIAAAVLGAAFLLSTSSAEAQKTLTINTGSTTVALSNAFLSALTSLKVTAGTIDPTQLVKGTVNFPVTGGAIDLQNADGQILHSGGLTLTAGKTEVKLQSFIIDTTGTTPGISGIVVADGKVSGRIALFDVEFPSNLTLPLSASSGILQLRSVKLTLDAGAATALNGAFDVKAFAGGLDIGTANVVALLPLSIEGD